MFSWESFCDRGPDCYYDLNFANGTLSAILDDFA